MALVVGATAIDPASGQGGTEDERRSLAIGPWWASASARGGGVADQDGNTIVWNGRIPAQFQFNVEKTDEQDVGTATGTWEHQGEALLEITAAEGALDLDLTFLGSGPVAGTGLDLILTGSATTSAEFGIGNTADIPPQIVKIGAVTCNEAYGEWAYTIERFFESEGYDAAFTGFFIGLREVEDVQDDIDDLVFEFSLDSNSRPETVSTQSPLVDMTSAMISEYNAFTDDYPEGWSTSRVIDMMARTEALLNEWRNLTECDELLFGPENVETFVNGLTFVMQSLIGGAGAQGVDSETFVQLAHAGARSGAFGPGAPNPGSAVQAEQALLDAGEAILEANVDPEDGQVFVNDDTERVMATGAAMGWEFQVNGKPTDARETWESTFGEPAPDTDGGEGDG